MNTLETTENYLKQINNPNHYFCRGNHTSKPKAELCREYGMNQMEEIEVFRYKNREIVLSHYPLDMAGLNANRSETCEDGRSLPMINIHAHTHSKHFHTAPYQVCVSADAINCMPITLNQAIKAALNSSLT